MIHTVKGFVFDLKSMVHSLLLWVQDSIYMEDITEQWKHQEIQLF